MSETLSLGDRVQSASEEPFIGTVVEVLDAGWLLVEWDADTDGGPYEDEVLTSEIRKAS